VTLQSALPRVPASRAGARQAEPRHLNGFSEVLRQVQAAGLMKRRYGFYWTRFAAAAVALGSVFAGIALLGESWLQLLLAAALGTVLAQLAFLGHEASHRQIFRSARWNDWSGRVLSGFFAGISYGWWMNKHSRHHGNPNKLGKDPDIISGAVAFSTEAAVARGPVGAWLARRQGYFFLPLLALEGLSLHVSSVRHLAGKDPDIISGAVAFSTEAAVARGPVGAWLARRQGYFFLPLLALEGLSLHVSSVRHLAGKHPVRHRWVEITFLVVRFAAYLAVLFWLLPPGMAFAFVGVQVGVFGFLLGGAFAPNHIGMPVVPREVKVDFLRRQVLMSRNVSGGPITRFFMGGLENQVEHHLFPGMARPNLRKARAIVQAYCAEHRITYTETTLLQSYRQLLGYLNAVGLSARTGTFVCPLTQQYRV